MCSTVRWIHTDTALKLYNDSFFFFFACFTFFWWWWVCPHDFSFHNVASFPQYQSVPTPLHWPRQTLFWLYYSKNVLKHRSPWGSPWLCACTSFYPCFSVLQEVAVTLLGIRRTRKGKMAPLSPCNASSRYLARWMEAINAHHGDTRDHDDKTDSTQRQLLMTEICSSMTHLRGCWAVTPSQAVQSVQTCWNMVAVLKKRDENVCQLDVTGGTLCASCAFSNRGQTRAVVRWGQTLSPEQTNRWRACQTQLAALAQGKSCLVRLDLFFNCQTFPWPTLFTKQRRGHTQMGLFSIAISKKLLTHEGYMKKFHLRAFVEIKSANVDHVI